MAFPDLNSVSVRVNAWLTEKGGCFLSVPGCPSSLYSVLSLSLAHYFFTFFLLTGSSTWIDSISGKYTYLLFLLMTAAALKWPHNRGCQRRPHLSHSPARILSFRICGGTLCCVCSPSTYHMSCVVPDVLRDKLRLINSHCRQVRVCIRVLQLAVWPWINHLTFLSFRLLICKMVTT